MKRVQLGFCLIMLTTLLWGCAKEEPKAPTAPGTNPEPDSAEYMIISAQVAGPPIVPFESNGDIWLCTWGDDDLLYVTWTDGGGPGQQFDDPVFATDVGVAALEGPVLGITNASSPFECIRSIHVPDGIPWGDSLNYHDDKPGSLMYLDGRLLFAGHTPNEDPDYGYIAFSDDQGYSWTEVPNSPWTKASNSVFRVLMLINMGRSYQLNGDGYVYGMGIGKNLVWPEGTVYLCRVPSPFVADYSAYEYFVNNDSSGAPIWSTRESDALPVPNLHTYCLGSIIYHEGSRHYIFMGGGGLYAAINPWGPWTSIPHINTPYDPSWQGGYIPGLITKDAGPDYFYFTMAGTESTLGYFCHIGKIQLQLAEIMP